MISSGFRIDSYTVSISNSRAPGLAPNRRRVINLTSEVLTHSIQTTATLYFLTSHPSSEFVGGIVTSNYYQFTLFGWLPIGEYDEIYDVLRSEKPVYCRYGAQTDDAFNPITTPTGSGVRYIDIRTGEEPVGEGPSDQENAINDLIANLGRRFEVALSEVKG